MYTYDDLLKDLEKHRSNNSVFYAGETVLGAKIPVIMLGRGNYPAVLTHASIHGREHITSALLMRLIDDFKPKHSTFYVLPMVNIDGVRIAQGEDFIKDEERRNFIRRIAPKPFLYKANASGVDLNVNFNADWGTGKLNVHSPAIADYIGEYPESEPETLALVYLTRRLRPVLSISWHSKGEIIYWKYKNNSDYELQYSEMAEEYAVSTGYSLVGGEGSAGGYKDWFISENYGLGLTIEVGNDSFSHPYPYSDLDNIYEKTKEVFRLADEHAEKIFRRRIYGRSIT